MRVKLQAITPKKPLIDMRAFERAVEDAMDEVTLETLSLYRETTRTWNTSVKFYARKTRFGRTVGTDSSIYKYVDLGTKPHIIRPKRARVLRFPTGGTPKTKAGRIQSFKGATGRAWVSKSAVQHPGTEARGFSAEIQERMQKQLGMLVRKNIRKAMGK